MLKKEFGCKVASTTLGNSVEQVDCDAESCTAHRGRSHKLQVSNKTKQCAALISAWGRTELGRKQGGGELGNLDGQIRVQGATRLGVRVPPTIQE